MAKINIVNIYGRVHKQPVISKDRETGDFHFGFCYVDTVRSLRSVGDNLRYVKHDKPMILSRSEEILLQMEKWQVNDIVLIKGVVHSQPLTKQSFCPNCKGPDGKSTRNETLGNLVSVTPIYMSTVRSYGDNKMAAVEDVIKNRELSNQVQVYGTLLKDPKIYTTKKGVQITQYPIAINRKFLVQQDDPTIKTDYPWVKSYGEIARDNKLFLKYQSEVVVDGFLQARNVKRKCKCANCGKTYEWTDNCMEIVPYSVEYIKGCRSREEIEAEHQKTLEECKQMIFHSGTSDTMEDGMETSDITKDSGTG